MNLNVAACGKEAIMILTCNTYWHVSVVVQLHAAITESEREKLDLEQRHSRQLQRVLEESQAQVDKMEAEYSTQIRANVSTACMCRRLIPRFHPRSCVPGRSW